MATLLKRPKFIIFGAAIMFVAFLVYTYISRPKEAPYEFAVVKKGAVLQEVSVTGKVKPAQNIELSFEKSGKVARVEVEVGDSIKSGQVLVVLDNSELSAQLLQAEANLEAEEARLRELKAGTRPEEIQIAETNVQSAETALKNAETNLTNVQQKAEADLKSAYDAALTALQKAVNTAKNSLLTLSDVQYAHFINNNQASISLADAKAVAVFSLLGAESAGWWTSESLSKLTGGAFGQVQNAVNNQSYDNIDNALSKTLDSLQKAKLALDAVPLSADLTSTEKTNINTEKLNINAEITTVSAKKEAVAVQKATNASNITSAQTSLDSAQNALDEAKNNLALKKAGAAPEQILAQEAKAKAVQANIENIQAQLAKTILISPIEGVVSKQEAKVGQIVSLNTVIVSVISEAKFEVEANIPEADIAKVKVGNTAQITLDAYGTDIVFETKAVAINPAETVIEGVPTYKTTFQFMKEDEKIKSGMTANLEILTDKKENVLIIPQRAVISRDSGKFAKVADEKGNIKELKIETGLTGSDGNIEVLSGLSEGEKVITFIKE